MEIQVMSTMISMQFFENPAHMTGGKNPGKQHAPVDSIIYSGYLDVKWITKKCCREQTNTLFVIVVGLRYNMVRKR